MLKKVFWTTGGRDHRQRDTGHRTNYAYGCDGNISHLETKTESAVLLSFDYQYDGNGNRTAKTGTPGLTAGSSALQPAAIDISYRYDVRGQLLEERRNNMPVCYEYDAAGNRIKKTEGERSARYHYNAKNQLICEENASGIKSFTYDRQGGIVEEKGQAGTRRFTYNSRHQQTRVETETGNIQENRYDSEGLRYELLENGRRTSFVYHNGELLYDEEGKEDRQTNYHLGAGIEAFSRGQETYYYQQDEQLSTAFITGRNGAVHNHYQYDAFGNELETVGELYNRIRYTGQQYDDTTGEYYLRARYYNPILGRFMQEDIYQGDGLNLYAYCKNNPVTYHDPSGYEGKKKNGCNIPSEFGDDGGNGLEGGNNSKLKWGNPKSTPTYGHTFLEHGQKQTAQQLIGRANGFKNSHQVGQWLDNQQAADFLANVVKGREGNIDVKLPSNIKARVFLPNGTEVIPDMAKIIIKPDGSIRTAYPYNSSYPT